MNPEMMAMISWVPRDKGGRLTFPSGPQYTTVVRFDEDQGWPADAWSLAVDYIRSYARGQYVYAKIHFLVPEAPHELLHEGSRFQLYEGRKIVATGLVRERDVVPTESNEFEHALLH
jgi:hypothetical protein